MKKLELKKEVVSRLEKGEMNVVLGGVNSVINSCYDISVCNCEADDSKLDASCDDEETCYCSLDGWC